MSSIESTVTDQYDQLANVYDRRWKRYVTNTLNFFKGWAEIAPTAAVLDIACGTGELERLLLQDNPTQIITGIDISEQMLGQAKKKLERYPNIAFEKASASDLPFPDQGVDVVVSANAFHYFPDPQAALAEMKRVLKPDGKLVILDWCRDFWFCRLCDWGLQKLDPAHQQCYTEAELHSLLENAGFRLSRAQRVRFDVIWGLMAVTALSDPSVQKL
ncbi:MAG: methyltransferase domain-containing protein [Nodosilinea sp.]